MHAYTGMDLYVSVEEDVDVWALQLAASTVIGLNDTTKHAAEAGDWLLKDAAGVESILTDEAFKATWSKAGEQPELPLAAVAEPEAPPPEEPPPEPVEAATPDGQEEPPADPAAG